VLFLSSPRNKTKLVSFYKNVSCYNHIQSRSFFATNIISKKQNNTIPQDDHGYKLTKRQKRALKLLETEPGSDGNSPNTNINEETIHSLTDISKTLSELKHQSSIQDYEHYENKPMPWYRLLTYPSRALWRSSPHLPPSYITETQFDIIQRSQRTSKQLRRTNQRVVTDQIALSERRERERRDLVNSKKSSLGAATSLKRKENKGKESSISSVLYKPEQTLCSLKFRLIPHYNITKRILAETQGLIGKQTFRPKKVLDVGIGCGSSSAAVLDFFYQRCKRDNPKETNDEPYTGIEWIHGIEPSQSMRDSAQRVLEGVIEGQKEESKDHDPSEQSFIHHEPRITLGESLSSTVNRDITKFSGTYDLITCSYTLLEIPGVAASLSLGAIMWEKLSPNGIIIFIEPGTPDGFNSLRSIRNMLLDCCPPPPLSSSLSSKKANNSDYDDEWRSIGDEECHVIAPCTHNGSCPMVRHQKNFFKDQNNSEDDYDDIFSSDDDVDDNDNNVIDWSDSDSKDFDVEDDDVDVEDDDLDIEDYIDDNDITSLIKAKNGKKSIASKNPTASETKAFDSSFCSFVHGMPGKASSKQGEKFSYLVLQKRITGDDKNVLNKGLKELNKYSNEENDNHRHDLMDTNIVDLLVESIDLSGVHLPKQKNKKEQHLHTTTTSNNNKDKMKELLNHAKEVEDKFLDSEEDALGLELVQGDKNRQSWGRIIRAPIKKKGHVIVDYCTSNRGLDDNDSDTDSETVERGKIIRQKITKSHSAKAAPGMYMASRKSRWGGLWPDVEGKRSLKKNIDK